MRKRPSIARKSTAKAPSCGSSGEESLRRRRRTPASLSPEKRNSRSFRERLRDDGNATTYAALSAFATRNAKNEFGPRAALALGLLRSFAGQAGSGAGLAAKVCRRQGAAANTCSTGRRKLRWRLAKKKRESNNCRSFRRDFPDSVMTEQAVTTLAQAEITAGKADDALAVLEAYPNTSSKPSLLLLQAQAREKAAAAKGEKPLLAAADYLDLYYRFPLNDQAKAAGQRIPSLQFALGEEFPGTPMQTQIARAEAFFVAKRWRDARAEYESLLPKLSGTDRERATLRVAQCDVQSGGKPELLSAVSLTDPELDAERIYSISQAHRSQKLESQMLDEVDQLSTRFPQSSWSEEGLFAAGNYYWVNMDRDRAADFYRRALDVFPDGQERPDRRMARGLDRLSGAQAGGRGFAGGLRPPVSHVELCPGCLVLAGPLLRALGKSGPCAKLFMSPTPHDFR